MSRVVPVQKPAPVPLQARLSTARAPSLDSYRFWGYATTFGALWGAVEITLGTYLHALQIPFGGLMLAGVGAALLVALRSIRPARGVVLAAGLVCAGIKFVSPAGAVVGPMIAILVESLLVELALTPLGEGLATGGLAGALALLWALTQKLLTQALFYGLPIVGIYKGILRQAEKLVHLPASGGASVAALFLLLVALLGVCFGVVGARVGAALKRQLALRDS